MSQKTIPIPSTATLDDVLREVRGVRGDLDICIEQGQTTGQAVARLQQDVEELKAGRRTHSEAVRKESSVNLEQDAAIAALHTKLDRLTGIAEKLEKVAANPMVRRIAYAAGGAVLTYLAARGYR